MVSGDIGVWTAAFFVIAAYSYLYKDNLLYRFAEHTMLGISMGYLMVIGIKNFLSICWIPMITGVKSLYIIPLILGLSIFTMYSKEYKWISRWPIAIIVGVGTAVSMRGALETMIIKQVRATFLILGESSLIGNINNVLLIVMVTSGLFYFYFTAEHKGRLGVISKIGRYTYMLCFGAHFGGTVLSRTALFIGRLQFLLGDWLGLLK